MFCFYSLSIFLRIFLWFFFFSLHVVFTLKIKIARVIACKTTVPIKYNLYVAHWNKANHKSRYLQTDKKKQLEEKTHTFTSVVNASGSFVHSVFGWFFLSFLSRNKITKEKWFRIA